MTDMTEDHSNRSIRKVFEDHLRTAKEWSFEEDIARNFSEDGLVPSKHGVRSYADRATIRNGKGTWGPSGPGPLVQPMSLDAARTLSSRRRHYASSSSLPPTGSTRSPTDGASSSAYHRKALIGSVKKAGRERPGQSG